MRCWGAPLSIFFIAIGLLSRLAPLTEPHGRLLRQFLAEDGYLMQTISRNIALGHGLSVSDGTIQTNGTQPLATFVFSFFYLVAHGDKIDGIFGAELFSVFISLGSAWLGATMSGTLGFFHDRTINLDGVVNPDALRARLVEGDVVSYIVAGNIEYLADLQAFSGWSTIKKDNFNRKFKLIVDDQDSNISIFKRVKTTLDEQARTAH